MNTTHQPVRIAVFASGGGSNFENLVTFFRERQTAEVALLVVNKAEAYALERAKRLQVEWAVVTKAELAQPECVLPLLRDRGIGFIVLAGFLPLVPEYLIDAFEQRIVNIHPSLLPKFGGKGMWGHHVHEAVKAAGERETGMTVHWVTPQCDEGAIIAQRRVALTADDTADDIARKEHELEMAHFPQIVEEVVLAAVKR